MLAPKVFSVIIGDINHSNSVDLRDVIIALQVCSEQTVSSQIFTDADVNNDKKIGLEEAIHTLKHVVNNEYSLGYIGNPSDYEHTIDELKNYFAYGEFVEQLPSSFNWKTKGKVTSAKNQGGCGSCWAFAAVGAFESKILIKYGSLLDLSEQQLVSCDNSSHGCLGGTLTALKYWYDKGPMLEGCTDYCVCDNPCSELNHCTESNYRTKDYYTVNISDMNEIKSSVYSDGPAIYGYSVYYDFYTFWGQGSNGQVYKQIDNNRSGGHAVLLIGWDDNKGAWLCKNSWGETDGPNGDGTFWIAYTGHKDKILLGIGNSTISDTPVTDTLFPVYRFYSNDAQNHFYTVSERSKNMLIADVLDWKYVYEGIEFYAYITQESGTVPVYRFYSPKSNDHFYTISESAKNNLIEDPNDWQYIYEGIEFYAYETQVSGTVPVYRFYSPKSNDHFYTISERAKDRLIEDPYDWQYKYEGIEFYVYQTR